MKSRRRRRPHRPRICVTASVVVCFAAYHSQCEWSWNRHFVRLEKHAAMTDSDLTPLLKGTVDLLVLRSLQHGPAHGYDVSRWVRERTDGVLTLEDAALYQALHRLEADGLVSAEWGLSENNRRAKYYELTAEGRRRLRREIAGWKRYAAAVFKVVETA